MSVRGTAIQDSWFPTSCQSRSNMSFWVISNTPRHHTINSHRYGESQGHHCEFWRLSIFQRKLQWETVLRAVILETDRNLHYQWTNTPIRFHNSIEPLNTYPTRYSALMVRPAKYANETFFQRTFCPTKQFLCWTAPCAKSYHRRCIPSTRIVEKITSTWD